MSKVEEPHAVPASSSLTAAERLKFALLQDGLAISAAAEEYITAANGDRPMTPADYASTSGVILALEDDVWVNAPIATYNPNFVVTPLHTLDLDEEGLVIRRNGEQWRARMWLPPRYHGTSNSVGEPYNSYAFTHADRVRISPVEGCSMTCQFCDLPYEFRYRTKSVEGLVDSVATALSDDLQPAGHVLISGGTPREVDFEYVQAVYEAVITGFPDVPVDIMMVPADGLLDVDWLAEIGVNELSINIEIFNREIARRLMRRKSDQGLDHYLDFVERAVEVLGGQRVRSMLIVGLEPMEDTLAGVEELARRGCVPVLSPFRPDESTPLRKLPPPSAEVMEETYLRAREIAAHHELPLGPGCIPCTHNTMTLAEVGHGDALRRHGTPHLI
jgi:Radical SAM superfamily